MTDMTPAFDLSDMTRDLTQSKGLQRSCTCQFQVYVVIVGWARE